MNFKSTIRATKSSYLGSVTAAATGLISIRLATHFLALDEFGLWSFTMQTVGYFILMDLGVSNSVGRLLGEPLSSGDQEKINSWITLSLLTLICQALLIVCLGLALRPHVLEWFDIPSRLLGKASDLWLAFLLIQAISLVFKLPLAILYAQNRVYWTNSLQIVGSWSGLGALAIMLISGWGVLSYAWSSAVVALVVSLGGILAVRRGCLRFSLQISSISWQDIYRLFKVSISLFALGLASQVFFASHCLVATKMLGLEAAAILAVTAKASSIALGLIWKPLDAFAPRWQVAYCNGDVARVSHEYKCMVRFTILIAVASAVCLSLANQPFVILWTKPEYFGGLAFSLLLSAFLIIQGVNRCFVSPFTLTLRLKSYCIVNIISVVAAIALMIAFTRCFGLLGIPMGLITADLVFPMWFYMHKGSKCLQVSGLKLLTADLALILPASFVAVCAAIYLENMAISSKFAWLTAALACAAAISAPLLWRARKMLLLLKET